MTSTTRVGVLLPVALVAIAMWAFIIIREARRQGEDNYLESNGPETDLEFPGSIKVWDFVSENVSKEEIIEIDRRTYAGLYKVPEREKYFPNMEYYRAYPIAIRPHPRREGYQIEFATTPIHPKEETPNPFRGFLLEEWRFSPAEDVLAFEQIVKKMAPHPNARGRALGDEKYVISADDRTDLDVSRIEFFGTWDYKQKHGVWSDVAEDVPKEVIIGIDRLTYGDNLGTLKIRKRIMAVRAGPDYFLVRPTSVRRHPEGEGYQVQFVLIPKPVQRGEKAFSFSGFLIEQWQYSLKRTGSDLNGS